MTRQLTSHEWHDDHHLWMFPLELLFRWFKCFHGDECWRSCSNVSIEFLVCASIHLWWSCLAFTAEKQVTQLWSWWWSCWLWWWLMTDVHQSMTPNTLFRCVSISWIGFVLPSLHLSLFLGLKFMTYLDFEQTSLKCWCWCKSLRRKVLTNCSFSPAKD